MDIRQLRYFSAIIEEGSISKASQRLCIAQPALSMHVRSMEEALGASLLFRTTRGVVPTEAGHLLFRYAKSIVGQLQVAQDEIRTLTAEPSGEVRLGLPGTISYLLSVPLIIAAKQRYPKIRLRIAEAMSGFITDWLREDRVDLAVLYFLEPSRIFTSLAVFSEELYVFGPAADSWNAMSGEVSLSDLAALPLVLPSVNHGLRQLLDRRATDLGTVLKPDIEVDSYGNIKQLVEKGLGYSVLPWNAISDEVSRGSLRAASQSLPGLQREVHLVHHSDRPLSIATTAILELCRETLLHLVETGVWLNSKRI